MRTAMRMMMSGNMIRMMIHMTIQNLLRNRSGVSSCSVTDLKFRKSLLCDKGRSTCSSFPSSHMYIVAHATSHGHFRVFASLPRAIAG